MKPVDKQLDRLLKAAAAAPKPAPSAAVFALEARVLGNWRASMPDESGEFLVVWFRRAAICGCILAIASVAWTIRGHATLGGGMAVADSAMRMGVDEP